MEYNVKFLAGLQAGYDALATKDEGTLYFCTDTGNIYRGSKLYTQKVSLEVVTNPDGSNVVTGATFDAATGKLTVTKGFKAAADADLQALAAVVEELGGTVAGLHTHDNKAELDLVKSGDVAKWDKAATDVDAHVADGDIHVTTEDKSRWDAKQDALTSAQIHEHANKSELDKIADGDKAKWDAEIGAKEAAAAAQKTADDHVADTDVHVTTDDKSKWNTAAGKVDVLVGDDANKSVRTIANEELAAQLIADGAKDSLDTLAEIAAWIQDHPDDAAAMNEAITALQKQLQGIDAGEGTVKKYVDDAIAALKIGDYAKASDLLALAERVTALETKVDVEKVSTAIEGAASKALEDAKSYVDELLEEKDYENMMPSVVENILDERDFEGQINTAEANAKAYTDTALTWGSF